MALEASGGLRLSSDSGYDVGWRLCFRVYIGCDLSSALTLTLNDSMPLIVLPIRNIHILQGKRSIGYGILECFAVFKNLYRVCLLYIYMCPIPLGSM